MTKRTCSIEDCADPVAGRGWCSKHYQRWINNGDPLIVKRRATQATVCERPDCGKPGFMRGICLTHYREWQKSQRGPCSVDDCGKPWQARGLCVVHYHRFQRTGSTDEPKPVHRSCSVDDCDAQVAARELCQRHYRNWRKYGTPHAPPKPEKIWLPCSEAGCAELAARKNGMCDRHYRKAIAASKPRCRQADCPKPVRTRDSFCESHGGWSRHLGRTYGITAERYDAMVSAQDGRCAICARRPEEVAGRISRLVIDHDHGCCPGTRSCGKCVRGLLCIWCNRLLGMAADDPGRLLAAIAYLKQAGEEAA